MTAQHREFGTVCRPTQAMEFDLTRERPRAAVAGRIVTTTEIRTPEGLGQPLPEFASLSIKVFRSEFLCEPPQFLPPRERHARQQQPKRVDRIRRG